VRTRNPAAESKDVVFPEPISAQPATNSVAATAAKIARMVQFGFWTFIFVFALVSGCELDLALGNVDNTTRYFFAI
jgi:hypothetical protein